MKISTDHYSMVSVPFSGGYINLSFELRFKSYAVVEQHQWSESLTTTNTSEGTL